MASLNTCYNESKNYSDKIMGDVTGVLDNKGISYTTKSSGAEVIITDNGQSENSIVTLLNNNLNIPKDIISLLLDVVEVSDIIYIRQKTK